MGHCQGKRIYYVEGHPERELPLISLSIFPTDRGVSGKIGLYSFALTVPDAGIGLMGPQVDAAALADFVIAIVQGMSVMARDGASRNALLAIADTALQAWPQSHVEE